MSTLSNKLQLSFEAKPTYFEKFKEYFISEYSNEISVDWERVSIEAATHTRHKPNQKPHIIKLGNSYVSAHYLSDVLHILGGEIRVYFGANEYTALVMVSENGKAILLPVRVPPADKNEYVDGYTENGK